MFTTTPRLQPFECAERVRSGEALLVDVREPDEWASGVAKHAVLLALTDLTGPRAHWTPFLAQHAKRELLVYCKSGGRSAIASRILASEGFRAANVGGLNDWATAGWPVVEPSSKAP